MATFCRRLASVAGIEPQSLNTLYPEGGYFLVDSKDLSRLARAAQATGRDVELVRGFDSIDLVRAVLAAERVAFKHMPELADGFATRASLDYK